MGRSVGQNGSRRCSQIGAFATALMAVDWTLWMRVLWVACSSLYSFLPSISYKDSPTASTSHPRFSFAFLQMMSGIRMLFHYSRTNSQFLHGPKLLSSLLWFVFKSLDILAVILLWCLGNGLLTHYQFSNYNQHILIYLLMWAFL